MQHLDNFFKIISTTFFEIATPVTPKSRYMYFGMIKKSRSEKNRKGHSLRKKRTTLFWQNTSKEYSYSDGDPLFHLHF